MDPDDSALEALLLSLREGHRACLPRQEREIGRAHV